MATNPELGITNPYALDETQFAAAVDLLKQQRAIIGRYWGLFTDQIAGFQSGDMVVGTTWQVTANVLRRSEPATPVEAILPKEGVHRLVRHLDAVVQGARTPTAATCS